MLMRRRSFLGALLAAGAAPLLSRAGVRFVEAAPSVLPIGSMIEMAGRAADRSVVSVMVILTDSGWLPCDGREIPRATYSRLFEVMGTTYGRTDNGFRLPALRGHFLRVRDVPPLWIA